MNLEFDNRNNQWIIHYQHLTRVVDYKDDGQPLRSILSQLEMVRLELIEEFRNEQIKKILGNEEDIK